MKINKLILMPSLTLLTSTSLITGCAGFPKLTQVPLVVNDSTSLYNIDKPSEISIDSDCVITFTPKSSAPKIEEKQIEITQNENYKNKFHFSFNKDSQTITIPKQQIEDYLDQLSKLKIAAGAATIFVNIKN